MNNFFKGLADLFTSAVSKPNLTSLVDSVKKVAVETSDVYNHSISIPNRASPDYTGSKFGNDILAYPADQNRESAIFHQCEMGNVPDFMRNPQPITVSANGHQLTYWVLPEVLAIGTDEDYLRVPLNPMTGRKVANLFNCVLPTKKMAMQIWAAATIKLTPLPRGAPYDSSMSFTKTFIEHNDKIQAQLVGQAVGHLVSGHKKDVVITNKLFSYPNNVAIYGWFYPNGSCIQGLNALSHAKIYSDYAHSIRLISRSMILDGQTKDFYDLLKDPVLSSLVSDEGPYDASHIYT